MGFLTDYIASKVAPLVAPAPGYLPYATEWATAKWSDWNTQYIIDEGSKKSAAVLQCIAKLVLAFPEAPIKVMKEVSDEVDDSPRSKQLLALLRNPNPFMSWEELQQITMMYMAIGGNAYWLLLRNAAEEVIQIWPKHAGVMWPDTDGKTYIKQYLHSANGEEPQKISVANVVHFRWPLVHPSKPWLAMSPLEAIGKEADIDSEIRRFAYYLLKNDAVVRTAIVDREGKIKNDQHKEAIEKRFQNERSGENVGKTAVFRGGLEPIRLGLDMQELAFDALHNVPEARIAGGFLMDVIYAGLTAGMAASTYDNRQGARQFFFEDTMVKLWRLQSGAMTRALLSADSGLYFWHDTRDVVALRKDQNSLVNRVHILFTDNLITRNEARSMMDMEAVEEGQDGYFNEISGGGSSTVDTSGDTNSGGGATEAGANTDDNTDGSTEEIRAMVDEILVQKSQANGVATQ